MFHGSGLTSYRTPWLPNITTTRTHRAEPFKNFRSFEVFFLFPAIFYRRWSQLRWSLNEVPYGRMSRSLLPEKWKCWRRRFWGGFVFFFDLEGIFHRNIQEPQGTINPQEILRAPWAWCICWVFWSPSTLKPVEKTGDSNKVHHENLVQLYGVCIDHPPLRIVTEFCFLEGLMAWGGASWRWIPESWLNAGDCIEYRYCLLLSVHGNPYELTQRMR